MLYIPLWICTTLNFWMHFRLIRALRRLEAAASGPRPPSLLAHASGASERGGPQGYGAVAEVDEDPRPRSGPSRSTVIIKHLRIFPIAMIVCWFPSFVLAVYEVVAPYEPLFWLYLVGYIFQTSNGIINSLISLPSASLSSYPKILVAALFQF